MSLLQVTPFVPCTSLSRQQAFYQTVLGFQCTFAADGYAFLRRDAEALRLVQVSPQVDLHHPERQTSFYIDVSGIDELYAAMQPAIEALPPGRWRSPFNQPCGQREFHVSDEDCTLVYFGEAVTR